MAAAELLRVADAENPGGARLAVQLAGELLGFLPVGDVRQHLALDETAHRVAHQLV